MNFLFPKQEDFFELFGALNKKQEEIAALLREFASSFTNLGEYSKRAKEIEQRGDEATHAIIDKLNKTFITPFDREDIYLVAHELDDIIDLIENVIRDCYLYQIDRKPQAIEEFVPLIAKASGLLGEMLDCLRARKHFSRMREVKIKIHEIEDEGDVVFGRSITDLFAKELDPVRVVKMKDVLEGLEHILDKYQKVSDIIESIAVKSS